MRTPAVFFLLLVLIFINFNCKNSSGPSRVRPIAVRLIPGVDDTCRVETGMDAVPEGNAIRIEWTDNRDERTEGYEVNRSVSPQGPFSKIVTIQDPGQRYYEDTVPSIVPRYYYSVNAIDGEGGRSDPSDTLSYRLILKAQDLQPSEICGDNPEFRWRDENSPHADAYIVRVREKTTGNPVWIGWIQARYGEEYQSAIYNTDGSASVSRLISGRAYEWRVDIIGNESRCGSESPWVSVTIQ
ncbi:MAG: hypothetical protein QUS35_00775 [bacterium]|nr:hypothetical protein [bacterium]